MGSPIDFLSEGLDAPNQQSVKSAMQNLLDVGAIDKLDENLTPLGHHLSTLPVDVHIGNNTIMGWDLINIKFETNNIRENDTFWGNWSACSPPKGRSGTNSPGLLLYECVQHLAGTSVSSRMRYRWYTRSGQICQQPTSLSTKFRHGERSGECY